MLIQWKREKIIQRQLRRLEKARQNVIGKVKESSQKDSLESMFKEIETQLRDWMTSSPAIMNWEAKFEQGLSELEQLQQQTGDNISKEHKVLQTLETMKESVASFKQLFGQSTKPSKGQQQKMADEQHLEKNKLASKTFLKFEKCFDSFESYELKACYLCLSIFPENSIIKKKPLIYWWIGEGLILETNGRTAEEVGEEIFEELITEGFLIPKPDHSSPSINSCMVHPLARQTLMFLAKNAHFFDFDSRWTNPINGYYRAFLFSGNSDSHAAENDEKTIAEYLTVFNLTEQYLQLGDWLSKLNSVRVLQLGRWQNDVKHHIEVENEDSTFDPEMKKNAEEVYLNGLGTQTSLRYLSLRGVSRMTSLPPVVAKLSRLEILDLRDCQGLQKLDFDASSLKQLTHLDVSECYLLESMPKGIEDLLRLQVLKGFVIGNARKDPCRVDDIVCLKNLRKLSIRIGKDASEKEDFKRFNEFVALQILILSWSGAEISLNSFTVPPKLKKLELRCAPFETPPKWLSPDELKTLEKLYIRGGKLSTLKGNYETKWSVKFFILKYLKEFKVGVQELREMFPDVEYLEKVGCGKDDPDILWRRNQSPIDH